MIIGGAVRDWLRGESPKDIDAYLLGADILTAGAVLAHHAPTPRHYRRRRELVAELEPDKTGFHLPIQVVAAPACHTMRDVLDTCDWNASAFGCDGMTIVGDIDQVGIGRPLKLLQVTNPLSTLSRGFAFADRLNMVFDYPDVVRLCEEFLARHDKRTTKRRKVRK